MGRDGEGARAGRLAVEARTLSLHSRVLRGRDPDADKHRDEPGHQVERDRLADKLRGEQAGGDWVHGHRVGDAGRRRALQRHHPEDEGERAARNAEIDRGGPLRRAEVRQGRPEGIRAYRFDGWELNLNTRRLTSRDGAVVPLSNGEFSLLVVLLGAPSRILSRDQILDLSRLHNDEVYNRSIDVQILRLRRKIERDPAEPRYIKTERGAGYVFGVPVETVY